MVGSVPELFDLLARDPSGLIGQAEVVWLDFKTSPYQLSDERQKFELAKDVSAMANAEGGVILMGVETQKDERRQEDVAAEIRSIAHGLVDVQQIKNVIYEWVFPRLDVDISAHPVSGGDGELWSIFIQRGRERDQPFIVNRSFLEDGAGRPDLLAVFERNGSHNRSYQPAQVHGWINRGLRASLGEPRAEAVPPMEEAAEVLAEDYSALGLPDQATSLYIQAASAGSTRLARFYRGDVDDSLYERLVRPRHNLRRNHGFNLPDIGQPERTQRGALRVVWLGEDSISVTPGGLTTAIQGQAHLSWATEKYAKPGECWINPLALVEFTLDFSRFFLQEVMSRSPADRFAWRVGMRGLVEGPVGLYLPERFDHFARKQEATVDSFDSGWTSSAEADSNRLAYVVLSEIYAQFGFDASVIPYTDGERISDDAILGVR